MLVRKFWGTRAMGVAVATNAFKPGARPAPAAPPPGEKQSVVTRHGLPAPGLSGIGWLRQMTPKTIGTKMGDARPLTLGGRGTNIRQSTLSPMPGGIARGRLAGLSNPRAPSTSWPAWRVIKNLAFDHKTKFFRLPDVGGGVNLGSSNQLTSGRVGGVFLHPLPLRWNVKHLLGRMHPAPGGTKSTSRLLKDALALGRDKLRPRINLLAGRGGLFYAQSQRLKPDAPDYQTGSIQDIKLRTERGLLAQHFTAPASTVSRFAIKRGMAARRDPPNIPVGDWPEAPAPDQTTTERKLAGSGTPPTDTTVSAAVAESGAQATDALETGGPPTGFGQYVPLLAVLAVGWMLFR